MHVWLLPFRALYSIFQNHYRLALWKDNPAKHIFSIVYTRILIEKSYVDRFPKRVFFQVQIFLALQSGLVVSVKSDTIIGIDDVIYESVLNA